MIVYNIEWDTTIDEEDENNFKKNLNRIEIPEYVYNIFQPVEVYLDDISDYVSDQGDCRVTYYEIEFETKDIVQYLNEIKGLFDLDDRNFTDDEISLVKEKANYDQELFRVANAFLEEISGTVDIDFLLN